MPALLLPTAICCAISFQFILHFPCNNPNIFLIHNVLLFFRNLYSLKINNFDVVLKVSGDGDRLP